MGFFSSRRAEPSPLAVERHPGGEHKSTARLIRSKFYGKSKPLPEYDSRPPPSFTPSITSIAERPERSDYYINGSEQHSTLTLLSTSSRTDARRSSTDAITMTLAQRLNELAVANAEGLVDDNEYRLLRQSLFERFASASNVPSESPVVKMVATNKPIHAPAPSTLSHKAGIMRTPSLRTQTSISSAMSNLFRRATRRPVEKRSSKDQDAMSVASHYSKTSMTIHPSLPTPPIPQQRQLSRQPSINSIHTAHSRYIPHDLRSISSKRSGRSQAAFSDANSTSRGFSRNMRVAEPPPSSFHPKASNMTWYGDDDRLKTAADIRAEISLVEAEERRLLDAFDGLEITTMSRHRQAGSEAAIPFRARLDLDLDDLRNSASVPTLIHNSHGHSSGQQAFRSSSTRAAAYSPSQGNPRLMPSVVALSSPNDVVDDVDFRDSPQLRLRQSPQDAKDASAMEMDDIQCRRADIVNKYQERLAFLKARLKGAEMHERLLRK